MINALLGIHIVSTGIKGEKGKLRKLFSMILLALLLTSMLAQAFNIQPVKASGTVYVRADGSVDPDTAPISTVDMVTYTFTDNIYDSIVAERSNIVIDGAGYTLQGSGSNYGFSCSGINNVTIQNTNIKHFSYGIYLSSSSNFDSISGNNMTNNNYGIWLWSYSSGNSISGNNITANNRYGICLGFSSNFNSISGNYITANNDGGIWLSSSSNNSISGNNIANNDAGISLSSSSNFNSISGNNMTNNNRYGIYLSSSSSNSISGNNITANNDYGVRLDSSSSNSISNNNITANNDGGIVLWSYSSGNSISGNNITASYYYGIVLGSSSGNSISGNYITANNDYGVRLDSSSSNSISNNNITANNRTGIYLSSSSNNSISGNNIANNDAGISLSSSSNFNSIFHNNFANNNQVYSGGLANIWDDGYPSGGNYWSDYIGVDTNSDGIGDTPYIIDVSNRDRYPLIAPITVFDAGAWNGVAYNVNIASNSTASDFQLNTIKRIISFNVTGVEGTAGFCRITIPNIIVQDLWQGNYTVLLNGEPWPFRNWTDATNTCLYINYTHSEHEIVVMPEFSSATILAVFMALTIPAVLLIKRKRPKRLN